MSKITCFFILFVPYALANMQNLEKCKYINADLPISTSNSLCPSNPCTVPNGAEVESTTTFKTSSSQSLKYNIDAYLGSFKIPMDFVPDNQKDVCKSLSDGKCPVKDGDVVTHKTKLPIEAPFEEVTIAMESYITDENKKPLFCYRTTVTVKNM